MLTIKTSFEGQIARGCTVPWVHWLQNEALVNRTVLFGFYKCEFYHLGFNNVGTTG